MGKDMTQYMTSTCVILWHAGKMPLNKLWVKQARYKNYKLESLELQMRTGEQGGGDDSVLLRG